jgi:hypothetical protein
MSDLKRLNIAKINRFLLDHPTWSEGLKVPDEDIINWFHPTLWQLGRIKSTIYTIFRMGLDELISRRLEGYSFDDSFRWIKEHGLCIPTRIAKWGYQEPQTMEELIDYMEKCHIHHEIVLKMSGERIEGIVRKGIPKEIEENNNNV